ncbi:unnamed protein product, partial [marine sediment metagenome]
CYKLNELNVIIAPIKEKLCISLKKKVIVKKVEK